MLRLRLAAALGLSVLNDSYTVANTLPNIVYELLLGGVLSSVMVPLLVRKPFSVDYAKLDPREANWPDELFLRVNMLVSLVWVLGFAAMGLADALVTFDPRLPLWASVAVSVAALAGAITFTLRYPMLVARKLAG